MGLWAEVGSQVEVRSKRMMAKLFDLNIEEILDNWEVFHAVREIIANALDEQVLSRSELIQIQKDFLGKWHIRDYGRGIKIEHFTQNENEEKMNAPEGIIGKFGVGLKDALATFGRHHKDVLIRSRYGTFKLREAAKHGFENIITLHIEYDNKLVQMKGTEVILSAISDEDIKRARSLFIAFSDETVIESTNYGQIIRKKETDARVYINGVLASEEPNFLFSYNITSLTDAMKKRLNRERLNVGRTTYTDRIKAILKAAKSKIVQDMLADQVSMRSAGTQCDELQWLEISQIAFNYLNDRKKVVFVTEIEIYQRPEVIDNLRRDSYTPVVVSDIHREKIQQQVQSGGIQLPTVQSYVKDFNQSFQFQFVGPGLLTPSERRIFDLTPRLFALVGIIANVPKVKISETMRITIDNTSAVWDPQLQAIIILRSQLSRPEAYAGSLLHEVTHAITHRSDVTREFEMALTEYLGKIAINALKMAGVSI